MDRMNNTYNFCPACGRHNKGWRYCPECGECLEKVEESTEKSSKKIQEELEIIKGIIKKFEEELKDAEADERKLLSLPKSEHCNPKYQEAWQAMQERKIFSFRLN